MAEAKVKRSGRVSPSFITTPQVLTRIITGLPRPRQLPHNISLINKLFLCGNTKLSYIRQKKMKQKITRAKTEKGRNDRRNDVKLDFNNRAKESK